MNNILVSPPIAFLIFIVLGMVLSFLASKLAATGQETELKRLSYACGQRDVEHHVRPDYNQFFPYAYFFTIMHVLVLIIATVPREVMTLPLLYLVAGVLALVILFRR